MHIKNWQLARKELNYQIKSKVLYVLTFLFIAFCIVNFQFLYSDVIQHYDVYKNTEQSMREQGFDIERELKKTPEINSADGIEEIENVLAYDFLNAQHSLLAFQLDKVLNNTFGWLSFVFFPFIFSIYGILVATYDYKYKTLKQKLVHSSFGSIFLSKIISIVVFCIFTILTLSIVSFLIYSIYAKMIENSIPTDLFTNENLTADSSNLQIILFAFLVTLIFSLFGLSIGFLIKSALVPSIIVITVNFIVPILGKYDFRNLLANFGHEIFTFNSNFILFYPTPVPLLQASATFLITIIGLVLISYLVSSKQSKYSLG